MGMMPSGRVAFEADYVQEMGVAVFEDSLVKRLHLMLKGRGRLLCFRRGEQNCTLDFHAVGVPYPCGRPNLRAVLEALLWVGPTLRKGPFEGRQADVWHFAFVVSETRRGRLVLTGR